MFAAGVPAESSARVAVEVVVAAYPSGLGGEANALGAHLLDRARALGWTPGPAARSFVVTLRWIGDRHVEVSLTEGDQVLADRELTEPTLAALKSTAWLMVRLTVTRALRPPPQERRPTVSPTPAIPTPSFTLPDAPPALPV